MRCLACDKALSDREAVRKFISGAFVDLCDGCLEPIKDQVTIIDQPDQDDEIDNE